MKIEWFYVGKDIQIQVIEGIDEIEYVGDIFDELNDLITVDEINPHSGEHWLENEGNIFSFFADDFNNLKEKGFCRIYYIGRLEDNVDMSVESDRDFMEWYNNN